MTKKLDYIESLEDKVEKLINNSSLSTVTFSLETGCDKAVLTRLRQGKSKFSNLRFNTVTEMELLFNKMYNVKKVFSKEVEGIINEIVENEKKFTMYSFRLYLNANDTTLWRLRNNKGRLEKVKMSKIKNLIEYYNEINGKR